MITTHELFILTKFCNDDAKILDSLFLACFWGWVKFFCSVSMIENAHSLNESTLNHATHVVSHQYWPPRELDYRYSAWPTIYTYITDTDNILFTWKTVLSYHHPRGNSNILSTNNNFKITPKEGVVVLSSIQSVNKIDS